MSLLDKSKEKFIQILLENNLMNEEIEIISAKTLTPYQAVGQPERDDYPILKGKEVLIEATFKNSKGQAYTDEPGSYKGKLKDILDLELTNNFERAILIATMNTVLKYLGLIGATIHCKNEELGICANQLVNYIGEHHGNPSIGLIGLQPGMAQALSKSFSIRIVDLDKDNFNKVFNDAVVEGPGATEDIIENCELIVATGSTVVNDTIDELLSEKDVIFYGTTVAAIAYLNDLTRFCYSAE
ncbi:MAG: hypothetical protein KQ78_00841 [Candidatus Izimaplasma bacterium HR2]|nr:MAG: hypothetical protein KQ78_00841 [Candidatus Izimaplasma bacterium HR2]